ncbi:MAG: hypothetical protein HIU89_16725 [Proteobacteria bacterium]|nr:hypothetical protein [Pseudomonadota bacterium]
MEIETLNSARKKRCPFLMTASTGQLRVVYGGEVKRNKTNRRVSAADLSRFPYDPLLSISNVVATEVSGKCS